MRTLRTISNDKKLEYSALLMENSRGFQKHAHTLGADQSTLERDERRSLLYGARILQRACYAVRNMKDFWKLEHSCKPLSGRDVVRDANAEEAPHECKDAKQSGN